MVSIGPITGKVLTDARECRNENTPHRWKEMEQMYRSSLVRGPPGQSLRVDRQPPPPRCSTPSGGPAYELAGRSPSAQSAAQAVGTEIGRDIKEGLTPPTSNDRHVPTEIICIDIERSEKRVRRKKRATQHGRPTKPYGSCPFPLRKGTFYEPVPISEGARCTGCSFPLFAKHP